MAVFTLFLILLIAVLGCVFAPCYLAPPAGSPGIFVLRVEVEVANANDDPCIQRSLPFDCSYGNCDLVDVQCSTNCDPIERVFCYYRVIPTTFSLSFRLRVQEKVYNITIFNASSGICVAEDDSENGGTGGGEEVAQRDSINGGNSIDRNVNSSESGSGISGISGDKVDEGGSTGTEGSSVTGTESRNGIGSGNGGNKSVESNRIGIIPIVSAVVSVLFLIVLLVFVFAIIAARHQCSSGNAPINRGQPVSTQESTSATPSCSIASGMALLRSCKPNVDHTTDDHTTDDVNESAISFPDVVVEGSHDTTAGSVSPQQNTEPTTSSCCCLMLGRNYEAVRPIVRNYNLKTCCTMTSEEA